MTGFCYFGLCGSFSNGFGQDVRVRLHSMFGGMGAGGQDLENICIVGMQDYTGATQ